MVEGLIVGHGDLSSSLIRALELISGDESHLTGFSNEGHSTNDLAGMIGKRIGDYPETDFIIFVDVYGGSCWRAAMMAKSDRCRVVAGVNLPMLLSFVSKRDTMPIDTLSETLIQDMKRSAILN